MNASQFSLDSLGGSFRNQQKVKETLKKVSKYQSNRIEVAYDSDGSYENDRRFSSNHFSKFINDQDNPIVISSDEYEESDDLMNGTEDEAASDESLDNTHSSIEINAEISDYSSDGEVNSASEEQKSPADSGEKDDIESVESYHDEGSDDDQVPTPNATSTSQLPPSDDNLENIIIMDSNSEESDVEKSSDMSDNEPQNKEKSPKNIVRRISPRRSNPSRKWRSRTRSNNVVEKFTDKLVKPNSRSSFVAEDVKKQEDFIESDESRKNSDTSNDDEYSNPSVNKPLKMVNISIKLHKIECSDLKEKGCVRIRDIDSGYFTSMVQTHPTPTKRSPRNTVSKPQPNHQQKQNFQRTSLSSTNRRNDRRRSSNDQNNDRRSLRLLGKPPEKRDLPESSRILNRNKPVEKTKKRRRSRSARRSSSRSVKRSLPRANDEVVAAKQSKLTKGSTRSGRRNSTAPKRVSFLLDQDEVSERTTVSAPPKVAREKAKSSPKESVNRRKSSEGPSKTVAKSQPDSVKSLPPKPQKIPLLPIRNYQKTIDVWYECECCRQKYHLLEQIKEHVRGHFPGCHTS